MEARGSGDEGRWGKESRMDVGDEVVQWWWKKDENEEHQNETEKED